MKRWLHCLLITCSLCGVIQIQALVKENEMLVSNLEMMNENKVNGRIVDEHQQPLVTQLRLLDEDGGFVKRIQTNVKGEFETYLEEGKYTLEISKGYEYEIREVPIEVKSMQTVDLHELTLMRLVDWGMKDYIAGDLNQYLKINEARTQQIGDVILSNLAVGLQFGQFVDLNSHFVSEQNQQEAFIQLFGQEIDLDNGSLLIINTPRLINAAELKETDDKQLMINQLRSQGGVIALNDNSLVDEFSTVDAIEIWSGQAMPPLQMDRAKDAELDVNMARKIKWFELLSKGLRITALGNSRNNDITGESIDSTISENELYNQWMSQGLYTGNPRNYVKVNERTVNGIIEGIQKGHVFITNGPLLDVTVNDQTFGDTIERECDAQIMYQIASNRANLKELNIIANGSVIEKIPLINDAPTIGTLTLDVSAYDWLIFEVMTTSYEYAISNPIYIN